jgi:hypothetical protein
VQWLTPVILATWEAEIRRILFGGQHLQNVGEIPSKLIKPRHGGTHLSSKLGGKHANRRTVVQVGLSINSNILFEK